ncbi:MAG: hypothetical protein BWY32_03694 [bacterium ADurb.Bin243]|nr:MAG: hypothetical protein BWY32_03694 [bacterium ADurb.Bin243]
MRHSRKQNHHFAVFAAFFTVQRSRAPGDEIELAAVELFLTWTVFGIRVPAFGRFGVFGGFFAAAGGRGLRGTLTVDYGKNSCLYRDFPVFRGCGKSVQRVIFKIGKRMI